MNDQNKKTLRQFQCRDYLWEIFEQMSGELECSVDYLINEAMRQYARSRNYGARGPTPDPTGQRSLPSGSLPSGSLSSQQPAPAPMAAPRPEQMTPGPGPRARIPSQPAIPSAPPPPPSRPSFPQPGFPQQGFPQAAPQQGFGQGGFQQPSPAPQQQYAPQPQQYGGYGQPGQPGHGQQGGYPAPPPVQSGGYPAPPAPRSSPGGYPAPPPYPSSGGYPAPPPARPQASAPSSFPPPPGRPSSSGGYGAPPPLPHSGQQMPQVVGSAGAHPAGMPTLFVIFNGQKFPVNKEEFIIGRGTKTADLAIKDGNISRRHAAIIFQNGGFYMKDLGSTNGVEYQGRRVDGRRIEEGDVYQLCDYELRFTYR